MVEPIAFFSYTTFDNAHDEDAMARFCERLSGEVRMHTGKPFPIFRDKKDIRWGQNWKARVEQSIDTATFLITILTPSYFHSEACRAEYEKFKEREKKLGRNDLILPVYYVECDELEDPAVCQSDPWFKDLSQRQYEDWRNLRFEPQTSPTIGRAFERLAKQIKQALKKTTPRPVLPPREGKPAESAEEAVTRRVRRAVTFATYTDPEYGFSIDVPDDWVSMTHEEIPAGVNAETGETITVAEIMAALPDLLPYYIGWRAPTPEYGVYPHVTVPVYALPMPFPPEGFWNLMLEPDGFYDLFPELDIVMAEGVRTAEDRAAYWASFTWTDADGHAIRTIVCFVSKAGNMYMLGGITTQDTWDQYEDVFEHICLSFAVPK